MSGNTVVTAVTLAIGGNRVQHSLLFRTARAQRTVRHRFVDIWAQMIIKPELGWAPRADVCHAKQVGPVYAGNVWLCLQYVYIVRTFQWTLGVLCCAPGVGWVGVGFVRCACHWCAACVLVHVGCAPGLPQVAGPKSGRPEHAHSICNNAQTYKA